MLQTQISKTKPFSQILPSSSLAAGRQCQGRLWSSLKDVCDLLHIPFATVCDDEDLLFQHVQFKAGQRVHTIGQPFDALYIVHSGFLKTVLIDEYGNEQVLSFPMKADILGVDGINSRLYSSEAVALSDCDLILLPFKKLTALARTHVELENAIYDVLSRELVREQAMVGMLGALSAEARVARFLVTLSDRFALMGYSSKFFNLRMTRHEIGMIAVNQRTIEIKDLEALKNLRRLPPSRNRSKQSKENKLAAVAYAVQ